MGLISIEERKRAFPFGSSIRPSSWFAEEARGDRSFLAQKKKKKTQTKLFYSPQPEKHERPAVDVAVLGELEPPRVEGLDVVKGDLVGLVLLAPGDRGAVFWLVKERGERERERERGKREGVRFFLSTKEHRQKGAQRG